MRSSFRGALWKQYGVSFPSESRAIKQERTEGIMERIAIGETGLKACRLGFGGIPIQRVSETQAVDTVLRANGESDWLSGKPTRRSLWLPRRAEGLRKGSAKIWKPA